MSTPTNPIVEPVVEPTIVEPTPPTNEPPIVEKAFTQSDIDRAVTQALKTREKTMKAELEDFYKKQAEMNTNKTAEEKAQELYEKMQTQIDEQKKSANVREAEVELKSAGFTAEEIAFYVQDVTSDKETSLARIYKICELQKAKEDALTKKFNEQMAGQFGSGLKSGSAGGDELQKQYDQAKSAGNLPLMSSLQRQAMGKEIKLKL